MPSQLNGEPDESDQRDPDTVPSGDAGDAPPSAPLVPDTPAAGPAAAPGAPAAHSDAHHTPAAPEPPDPGSTEPPDPGSTEPETGPIGIEALAPAPAPPMQPPAFGARPMWSDSARDYSAGPLPLEHEGITRQIETGVLTGARWVDRFQSRVPPVAFAYATFKKYADDEGSRLAALLAYYTFISLFPLMIGGVAVLNRVLANYPSTVQQIIEEVVPHQYQDQILDAYYALPDNGAALWVAVIGLLIAGTGGVFSLYATVNQVFAVPYRYRYGFGPRYLRVIAAIVIMAVAVLIVAVGGSIVGTLFDIPAANRAAVLGMTSIIFSASLYWAAKILSRRDLRPRDLLLGALLGGTITTSVVSLGSLLVSRIVAGSSPVYGAFATVIAIISVMMIAANGVVISLEISVVRAWQLWPRGIDIHLLFPADERAYALLTLMDERMPSQRNDIRFDAEGHFDPRRPPIEVLNRRQPGVPRSPYDKG